MGVRIKLTVQLQSDFHIGTGSGRGRATDAVFLSDESGLPYISGSTIKGLASTAAKELIRLYDPHLGTFPEPNNFAPSPFYEVFGGGNAQGYSEDRVFFDDARLPKGTSLADAKRVRTGRNARDRVSGTAKQDHLFYFEDAPAATFESRLTTDANLSPAALLLLLLSLRRIEAMGGQRRRGKGRVECSVSVVDAGEFCSTTGQTASILNGLNLPDTASHDRFVAFAKPILTGSAAKSYRSLETSAVLAAGQEVMTDTCWLVYAVAEPALAMSHDQAVDNVIQSADFVSGTALRGAIAWHWLRRGLSDTDPVFAEAIAKEKVVFGPLYPVHGDWPSPATMPFPMPASIYTCKRYSGPLSNSPNNHGVADRFRVATDQRCKFANCGAALTQCGGYVQLAGHSNRPLTMAHADVALRVLQRNNVAHSQLFGIEAVPRGTWFAGYVWGPEHLLQSFLAPWAGPQWETVRVGKVRTRGLGNLSVRCVPAKSTAHPVYANLLKSDSSLDSAVDDPFCVTLYSDTIALDRWMRPLTCLDARELWRQLNGTGDVPFRIESGYVTARRIGGYLGTVGLPRTADIALQAGSTWKLAWTTSDSAQRSSAVVKLRAAQSAAIGFRRAEGFGRIMINCPVHLIGNDTLSVASFRAVCDTENRPGKTAEARTAVAGDHWMLHCRVADHRTVHYRRLLSELSQAGDPAEAFEHALNTSRRVDAGKRESFSRFVDSNQQRLFPDHTVVEALRDLKSKPADSREVKAFIERLIAVAEGR